MNQLHPDSVYSKFPKHPQSNKVMLLVQSSKKEYQDYFSVYSASSYHPAPGRKKRQQENALERTFHSRLAFLMMSTGASMKVVKKALKKAEEAPWHDINEVASSRIRSFAARKATLKATCEEKGRRAKEAKERVTFRLVNGRRYQTLQKARSGVDGGHFGEAKNPPESLASQAVSTIVGAGGEGGKDEAATEVMSFASSSPPPPPSRRPGHRCSTPCGVGDMVSSCAVL
jgi:hypothetical protein